MSDTGSERGWLVRILTGSHGSSLGAMNRTKGCRMHTADFSVDFIGSPPLSGYGISQMMDLYRQSAE